MKRELKIVELFAGKQSLSIVAKKKGHKTFTSDINRLNGIDYVVDILDFDVNKVPFIPDFIWASPDCATWSIASGNLHFNSKSLKPKTKKAELSFLHIDKMLEIIFYFLKINPEMFYFIENPVGKLNWYINRGNLFENKIYIPRTIKLTQSSYGRIYKKPTHLFTNNFKFIPRRLDKRILGTNLKDFRNEKPNRYYCRALIPDELCNDIINSCL